MRPNLRLGVFGLTFVLFFSALIFAPRTTATKSSRAGKTAETKSEQTLPASRKGRETLDVDDPDRPRGHGSEIGEAEDVRLREEQIARMRGYEPGKPFDPQARGRALREMERQESALALTAKANRVRAEISGTTWTPIGPAPIPNGQTFGVASPVSGRVTAIDVHPTNPNIAYVGTADGGLYRTLDGGNTWTPLMDDAQALTIGAVTIDPQNPSIVFVGTGEGNSTGDSLFGVGLYRIETADTTPVLKGPFETRVAGTGTGAGNGHAFVGTAINKIVIDPADENRIFVGNIYAFSGISLTSNCCNGDPPNGALGLYFCANAMSNAPTFSLVSLPGFNEKQGVSDVVVEPGSSDNLIFGVRDASGLGFDGIYRSTNASVAPSAAPTFTRVVTLETVANSKLAIYKQGGDPAVVLAAIEKPYGHGQLIQSTDGGATFPTTLTAANEFCGGQCYYDIALAVDPGATTATTDDLIYLGGQTNIVKRSTDGGASFSNTDTGLHPDSHALRIAPSDSAILYTGNDGGIWRSLNANDLVSPVLWTNLNNSQFSATQFESIAVHPTDANETIGGTQDNGTVIQVTSGSWIMSQGGDGGAALIDRNAVDTTNVTMYHAFQMRPNGIGYLRTDTTANALVGSWSPKGCVFGTPANGISCSDSTLFYAPMALGPNAPDSGGTNTVYLGTDRLYRSADKGDNNAVVSQAPLLGAPISAIGISPQNDNVRLVATVGGALFATTTGSSTLTDLDPVGPGSLVPDKYIARAVIDPNNQNVAYVTFDTFFGSSFSSSYGHVWKTTNLNSGTPTWTSAANGIPDIPVNALVIDPQDSNHLYAGCDIGVYISFDAGASWNPYGHGLPRVAVFDMAIQNSNRILRIATHGKGMWEITLLGPSAAPANISGNVTTQDGGPLAGVIVRLSGPGSATAITDSDGFYCFNGVDTGNFYIVTPSLANFGFSPINRSFSLLGNKTDATFTAVADAVMSVNAIDTNEYFVRQQYLDFLGREPDQGGFNYWSDQLNHCNAAAACILARRIDVSAAFFVEQEFQQSGSFIYDMYRAALGRQPLFVEYLSDRQQVVAGPNLETRKQAFAEQFVERSDFVSQYQANLSGETFVDLLLQNIQQSSAVDLSAQRVALLSAYNSGGSRTQSRARVLGLIANDPIFRQTQYNSAFVLAEYFGYLRRDPDQVGYQFWLNVLNNREAGNYRGMVCAFLTAAEYQRRFSPAVTHSNAECGP